MKFNLSCTNQRASRRILFLTILLFALWIVLAIFGLVIASGMVANAWFDRETGAMAYNIEDPDHHLLTAGADVDSKTEIDPTQKAAKVDGRSPSTILSSTFSDELAVHYWGRSKIFGVSIKDRGAVSLAGHAGKAFWFSKAGGGFVTSSYYYDEYPEWVKAWNARKPAQAYAGQSWELMHDSSKYLFGDSDDREYETDFPGFGRTFPHPYGDADDKYFTTRLTLGPAGDELTLNFAKALLDNEALGQDEVPDYLATLDDGVKGLKLGLPKEYFGDGIDPAVRTAVRSAVDRLAAAGAEIVDVSLPHTEYAVATYYIVAPAEASSNLSRFDGV